MGIKPVVQLHRLQRWFSKWWSRDDFPCRVTCFSLVIGLSGCTSSTFSLFCSHFHPLNSPLFIPLNDPQHPFPLISSSHELSLTPQLNQQLLHNSAALETCHRCVDYCCYCTLYTQTGHETHVTSSLSHPIRLHLHVCVRPLQTSNRLSSILHRQWSEVIYFWFRERWVVDKKGHNTNCGGYFILINIVPHLLHSS